MRDEVLYRETLQAAGLACTVCGLDFRTADNIPRIPAEKPNTFACEIHEGKVGDKEE